MGLDCPLNRQRSQRRPETGRGWRQMWYLRCRTIEAVWFVLIFFIFALQIKYAVLHSPVLDAPIVNQPADMISVIWTFSALFAALIIGWLRALGVLLHTRQSLLHVANVDMFTFLLSLLHRTPYSVFSKTMTKTEKNSGRTYVITTWHWPSRLSVFLRTRMLIIEVVGSLGCRASCVTLLVPYILTNIIHLHSLNYTYTTRSSL